MYFKPIVVNNDGMYVWAAARGMLSFIVTRDDKFGGEIFASVKSLTATPNDGTRHDLGEFDSVEAAMEACRRFKPS